MTPITSDRATAGRTAPAEAGTGMPPCSAVIALAQFDGDTEMRPALVPCTLPAAGWWVGRCRCGHVRDGWLCEPHAELASLGGCRTCRELPEGAHDCLLLDVSRVTPGGPS